MGVKIPVINRAIPQNIIFEKPLVGSTIIMLFCLMFTIIYRPLNTHESLYFNFEITMVIYSLSAGIFSFLAISILKLINFFSTKKTWTLKKEFISILIVLIAFSIGIYMIGFFIEPPTERINIYTFIGASKYALLIGGFPIFLITLLNSKHVLFPERIDYKSFSKRTNIESNQKEIKILSNHKKGSFLIDPIQIIYIESNGNYIDIYWLNEKNIEKKILRTPLKQVFEQLSYCKFFFQTHRAFIVNMYMIESKSGNSLGYTLQLKHTNNQIPVSRQKVKAFDKSMAKVK